MLADQTILRIPGPTPIPPSVERAMNIPMVGHRSSETSDLIRAIQPKLQPIFGTKQDVVILAGSGTAALEAAVVNAVRPLDEVLVIVTGAFGARFVDICEAYGIRVHQLQVEWGKAVDPKEVTHFLEQHKEISTVFATYCETSTGVLNPIDELAKGIRSVSDALFIVDGVSCVGGVPAKLDDWGIDILVTGSQKALMLPAGLAFVAMSERAFERIQANPNRGFYFDLIKYRTNLEKNTTPFTPALSLLFGLNQALDLLEKEGLENVYRRHSLLMEMTRAAFKAHHIPLLTSDQDASPTVTAIRPADFDAEEFRKVLKNDFRMSIAGGQGHLKGEIFRIGHMGYCSPADVIQTIGLVEIALMKTGKQIELGKGVAAAQQIYLERGTK
ncbi:pyridoxal-phosphate-dependent aminotransferase family protein [Sporosarcina cyprini]|uniref:pyridoxal-phosphate-dependent aminotransferase family protein n=1 Tax=Sporosarcina cyprini TaxID=2910523 RepID=UPI001EDD3E35|nr:alanine--glyoxylate aminotransferase family protein [Sporosarcina cyprini]MCG3089500.1 alanine--glyoxylate aminotransferase family protein [Sporosarcina cyprini]